MSLDNMITSTVGLLKAVTGVGANVYGIRRWTADEATFNTLFKSGTQILGFEVTRETTTSRDYVGGSFDTHQILILGYMSLKDSANTEQTFQKLIEAIRTTFQTNRRLTFGGVAYAESSERIQVRKTMPARFHGVLCHYVEMILSASEHV